MKKKRAGVIEGGHGVAVTASIQLLTSKLPIFLRGFQRGVPGTGVWVQPCSGQGTGPVVSCPLDAAPHPAACPPRWEQQTDRLGPCYKPPLPAAKARLSGSQPHLLLKPSSFLLQRGICPQGPTPSLSSGPGSALGQLCLWDLGSPTSNCAEAAPPALGAWVVTTELPGKSLGSSAYPLGLGEGTACLLYKTSRVTEATFWTTLCRNKCAHTVQSCLGEGLFYRMDSMNVGRGDPVRSWL